MNCFLDIEVVPNLTDAQVKEISDSITVPGTYKKPESIAEWEATTKPKLVEEACHKACFDGSTGKIICIAWAFGDEEVNSCWESTNDDGEASILETLFTDIHETTAQQIYLVGHNVAWDARYIWQRAVVHQIKPPVNVKWIAKPWDYIDTLSMWNDDKQRRISLDKLCQALGIESPKGELDGSKVWDFYKQGRIGEIAKYCAGDVEAMRKCYKRMTFQ